MKFTYSFVPVVLAAGLVIGGCSSTGTRDGAGSGAGAGASVEDRRGGAVTSGASGTGAWSASALNDPNSLLYTKTIYFDFDQSTIRSEFIEVLRAHASYLNRNLAATVLIEGHADERGSREYNIGLGERRANAIKRFLEAEGVSEVQINTISYGEERPAAFGQDEVSWAQNRRGVLVY
jgi:peptidoglycan-associated lipoprotein